MRFAVMASLFIHLAIFGYFVIGEGRQKSSAYPRITTVDLVSLPPVSRGAPDGSVNSGRPQQSKAKTRPQEKISGAHMTEIQKNKKPARNKPPEPEPVAQKPGESAKQPGLPQGVVYGSEFGDVSLEGGAFETPTYLNILFAKIKRKWDNPFQGADKISCIIYFTIEKGGAISEATIEQSSGIAAFDQSALRAVLSAHPPPLPLEYSGTQLGIHLEFQFLP